MNYYTRGPHRDLGSESCAVTLAGFSISSLISTSLRMQAVDHPYLVVHSATGHGQAAGAASALSSAPVCVCRPWNTHTWWCTLPPGMVRQQVQHQLSHQHQSVSAGRGLPIPGGALCHRAWSSSRCSISSLISTSLCLQAVDHPYLVVHSATGHGQAAGAVAEAGRKAAEASRAGTEEGTEQDPVTGTTHFLTPLCNRSRAQCMVSHLMRFRAWHVKRLFRHANRRRVLCCDRAFVAIQQTINLFQA